MDRDPFNFHSAPHHADLSGITEVSSRLEHSIAPDDPDTILSTSSGMDTSHTEHWLQESLSPSASFRAQFETGVPVDPLFHQTEDDHDFNAQDAPSLWAPSSTSIHHNGSSNDDLATSTSMDNTIASDVSSTDAASSELSSNASTIRVPNRHTPHDSVGSWVFTEAGGQAAPTPTPKRIQNLKGAASGLLEGIRGRSSQSLSPMPSRSFSAGSLPELDVTPSPLDFHPLSLAMPVDTSSACHAVVDIDPDQRVVITSTTQVTHTTKVQRKVGDVWIEVGKWVDPGKEV